MEHEEEEKGRLTYNVDLVRRYIEAIDKEAAALADVRKFIAEFDAEMFNSAAGVEALRAASWAGHWGQKRAELGEICSTNMHHWVPRRG